MKRDVIVGKLIAEGLSEKTLVKLNDKQLLSLAERMLSEQVKKGSVVMPKSTSNPQDVKKLTDQGLNVELREKKNDKIKKCEDCGKTVKDCKCDQSHLEETPNVGKKVTKGHNGIPEFMDSKKLKESEVKKWVKGLVENEKFHSFTSKNEIMELIKVKLTENKSEPSKPDTDAPVREKPTTKPGKPKRENPFEPKHTPKPKALGEDGDTKTAPVKPKVKPGTKPKKENPFEPKHSPKPKALGEEGDKKNKMPEFMKFKNLGFKFKD
jgi:ribosomal protein L34E